MNNRIYAMDTHFMAPHDQLNLQEQCQLISDLGYDDYYITADLSKLENIIALRDEAKQKNLGLSGVFFGIDLKDIQIEEKVAQLKSVIAEIKAPTQIEFAMTYGGFGKEVGNQEKDDEAVAFLQAVMPVLDAANFQVCLYPHFGFMLETLGDALRLVEKSGSETLGVAFTQYHWFRADQSDLETLLNKAGDRLMRVNLSGSKTLPKGETVNGLNPTISPVGEGEVDQQQLFEILKKLNYSGPIGVQGYGNTSDPELALAQSMKTLKGHLVTRKDV